MTAATAVPPWSGTGPFISPNSFLPSPCLALPWIFLTQVRVYRVPSPLRLLITSRDGRHLDCTIIGVPGYLRIISSQLSSMPHLTRIIPPQHFTSQILKKYHFMSSGAKNLKREKKPSHERSDPVTDCVSGLNA
ncbi:hypothetical protein M758_5G070500 [Ceratodon purpureus]|nr:hypothetical protein M758_5G070500 [Ceratodon purpureus]